MMQRADKVISEKDAALKNLRNKLSSHREDHMRKEIEDDVRKNFSSYTKQLQMNHEKCRASLHEANIQTAVLKAKLESAERSHQRALQELELKHKAEANQLQVEIQRMKAQESQLDAEDVMTQLLNAQRENADLQSRVKLVSLDLKEAKHEKHCILMEHQATLQKRTEELATIEEANKITEAKLKSMQQQKDALEDTLGKYRQETSRLSQQLLSNEEEKASLKNKLSLAEQRHKAELAQLKTDSVRQKAELEHKYEKTLAELANAKADAELAVKNSVGQKHLLEEKEKELEQKHQAARSKDWEHARKLESEKILLEGKLKELATAKAAALERLAESDLQVKRLKHAEDARRQEMEEEIHALKTRIKTLLDVRDGTNKVAAENHILQQRLELAAEQHKNDTAAIKDAHDEKNVLSAKVESLQFELQSNREQKKIIASCRSKMKTMRSAKHEMEAEAVHLKQSVPLDVHRELQDELKKLRRKQLEFHALLQFPLAHPDSQSLGDISRLKEKLDHLDLQQREQMEQMITFVKKFCGGRRAGYPSSVDSSSSKHSSHSKSSSTSKEHPHLS
ncbi:hypothetical protein HPB48_003269 [Haemaphysalis longicornis]|uniref:Uncharacterized protein n=1 Tax=Haemaphysalis longicornis TaxID=44386 RepID=A0A9J6H2T3_HAELO|nr:hypothetical protein HPB48_003269 [Haemaphysalis longicornis]